MRWMTMAMVAMLAACGVESADVMEADGAQKHFEINLSPTVTTTTQITKNCSVEPWKSSRGCQGIEGDQVASTAGGTPEGMEPDLLRLDFGELFLTPGKDGSLTVATGEKGEDVVAIIDGAEGVVGYTAYEQMDDFTDRVGTVGLELDMRDGSKLVINSLIEFDAEVGYGK